MTAPNPAAALVAVDGLPDVLTPAEVAALFGVDPKTVSRWVNRGKLASFRTPGGHHRFHLADILPLLRAEATQPEPALCALCHHEPAAPGSDMCTGCGEAHAYYASLTPEERRAEDAAMAAYVDQAREDA